MPLFQALNYLSNRVRIQNRPRFDSVYILSIDPSIDPVKERMPS